MTREQEVLQNIYSRIAPEIDELYKFFQDRDKLKEVENKLQEEEETEKQIDILVGKKYIPKNYSTDLEEILQFYIKGMMSIYESELQKYINKVHYFLNQYR